METVNKLCGSFLRRCFLCLKNRGGCINQLLQKNLDPNVTDEEIKLIFTELYKPFDGNIIDHTPKFLELKEVINSFILDSNFSISDLENSDMISDAEKLEIIRKRENLKIMKERFTWNYKKPPKKGQALQTLSQALFDKFQMIKPYLNNEMTGYENDEYFDIVC